MRLRSTLKGMTRLIALRGARIFDGTGSAACDDATVVLDGGRIASVGGPIPDGVTVVDLPGYGRISVAICYDIRFTELAAVAARRGAFALVYPGAFNMTTGPLHWKLLAQARAVDNQLYVALCSPARDEQASYRAWGHALVVDPMAKVLVEAEEKEAIVYADLEPDQISTVRRNIPLTGQRRFDVYPDVSKAEVSEGGSA